jgi:hypothetical protein
MVSMRSIVTRGIAGQQKGRIATSPASSRFSTGSPLTGSYRNPSLPSSTWRDICIGGINGKGQQDHASSQEEQLKSSQAILSAFIIIVGEGQTILGNLQQDRASHADAKPLPPGIAKKIARGGAMPPGTAKRHFPPGLISQLPAGPEQQWAVAGTDVLLVQTATALIVDLIDQAFRVVRAASTDSCRSRCAPALRRGTHSAKGPVLNARVAATP